jgi:hypothetical protein
MLSRKPGLKSQCPRASSHTKERAIAVVERRKRTERGSRKERYIEAEQDPAESGEGMEM